MAGEGIKETTDVTNSPGTLHTCTLPLLSLKAGRGTQLRLAAPDALWMCVSVWAGAELSPPLAAWSGSLNRDQGLAEAGKGAQG